jgi:hypothetical protein
MEVANPTAVSDAKVHYISMQICVMSAATCPQAVGTTTAT